MTNLCAWCRRPLPAAPSKGAGRPREYCKRSCRQRAYEARRQVQERSHNEDDLILERATKEELLDRLDVLRRTFDDLVVQAELGPEESADPAEGLATLVAAVAEALGRR